MIFDLAKTLCEDYKMRHVFILFLALVFVSSIPGWTQADSESAPVNEAEILAVINDEPITKADVERVYRSIHMNLSPEQRESFDFY